MDATDQQFAGVIDIRPMAQRARHDRLNYSKDVLYPVIEFIDHRRVESAFEIRSAPGFRG